MEMIRGRTPEEVRKYDLIKLGVAALLLINWLYFGIGKPAPQASHADVSNANKAAPDATSAPNTAAAASSATPAAAARPAAVSVYFEFGKAAMPGDAAQTLAPMLDHAKAEPNARFDISGFHDRVGDPSVNAELAKHRAQAVRDYLQAQGLADDRINLVKPQLMIGGSDDRQARRVDVSVDTAGAGK
jgi:cytochrome c oxidase subunit II